MQTNQIFQKLLASLQRKFQPTEQAELSILRSIAFAETQILLLQELYLDSEEFTPAAQQRLIRLEAHRNSTLRLFLSIRSSQPAKPKPLAAAASSSSPTAELPLDKIRSWPPAGPSHAVTTPTAHRPRPANGTDRPPLALQNSKPIAAG